MGRPRERTLAQVRDRRDHEAEEETVPPLGARKMAETPMTSGSTNGQIPLGNRRPGRWRRSMAYASTPDRQHGK